MTLNLAANDDRILDWAFGSYMVIGHLLLEYILRVSKPQFISVWQLNGVPNIVVTDNSLKYFLYEYWCNLILISPILVPKDPVNSMRASDTDFQRAVSCIMIDEKYKGYPMIYSPTKIKWTSLCWNSFEWCCRVFIIGPFRTQLTRRKRQFPHQDNGLECRKRNAKSRLKCIRLASVALSS